MRKKWRKRGFVFVAALLAGTMMAHGIPELVSDINAHAVYAEGENVVSFETLVAEANDAGFIQAKIVAQGTANAKVTATYRTSSGTGIENIDYLGVYNTASMTLDGSGYAEYFISVQCLNDADDREKLRVYDSEAVYGRYFNINLIEAGNADIDENAKCCKCYLPYNYKVPATTHGTDGVLAREVAYLNDYKDMQREYHAGENDISGKETWKTWKHGVSFNNDTSRRWVNAYINPGIAKAYGSYILKSIDDDKLHSTSNIYMLSGNKEFMDKYERSSSCPGLTLYYEIEPCTKGGYRLDGKAMYYISKNKNPHSEKGELVDLQERHVCKDPLQYYWIQPEDAWYSSKNSLYDSVFYPTDPYNGILDYGFAIFNNNKSWDREVHNIWVFLTLIDTTCPTIVKEYSEYNMQTGTIRVYLRFNEPVYSSKKGDIVVKLNNYGTKYYASYVDGNYSDTLVYEIPADKTPNIKIDTVTYELPTEDIGDMAYRLNRYKAIENNLVQNTDMSRTATVANGAIDLAKPVLAATPESSARSQAVYNVMLSANGNGETTFDTGTVYYSWTTSEEFANPTDPASYDNTHVLTSEERGSFGITLMKSESLGVDSGTYYLHALAVSQFGIKQSNYFGPYVLDGDPPSVNILEPELTDLRTKSFGIQILDKALGTDIAYVTMAMKYTDVEEVEQVDRLTIYDNGSVPTSLSGIVAKTEEPGSVSLRYRSNIDEDEASIPLDSFLLERMAGRPQMEVEYFFEIVDGAGNKASTTPFRTVYDKRDLFTPEVVIPGSYAEVTDPTITLPAATYDIAKKEKGDGITFRVTDDETKALIDPGGATFSVLVNGQDSYTGTDFEVTLDALGPGYYQAIGVITNSEGEVAMVSKSTNFYLTNGLEDENINCVNSRGNLVLTNRVFRLEDVSYYYFQSANSSVATHPYGAIYNPSTTKYEGGSYTPTFSSSVEAKRYVKYMEYQDLELIALTSSMASLLNGGSGSTAYVKAAKETKNAQEGQLWVRYKKASWTTTSGPSGWAFYYYGEGDVNDGLNVNGLSTNLNASIDAVTNRILDAGKDLYLVGEDYTNRITGAPYLADASMHVSRESVSASKAGTPFVTEPVYPGDSALFRNDVTVDEKTYPLATNLALEVGKSTYLYFQYLDGTEWTRIEAEDGALLKNAMKEQATGIYRIREYGEAGVSEFMVYLDRSIPVINATIDKDIPGKEQKTSLDGSITELSCQNLSLDELVNEADDQAYVAIYSYPNRVLQNVLYGSAIHGYSLSEGNFYLTVGDRSGNVVSYIIRTDTTPIDLVVEENEAKTGVVVKVNNRSASEIYSYEVYLNENLIDNEFDTNKFYRGSGIYRVEVVDIYNKEPVIRTVTHEAPSPDLTWYYQNDSGGYSAYDPSRPVHMILEDDPNSPRTTNVYASTMVRVLFVGAGGTDDVQFEMLDIAPEDYSYNATTGVLAIQSLTSWRLRVWYKNQPQNDRTYVFHVDNTPPEISASFYGTTFQPYVETDGEDKVIVTSTFDTLDFDKYKDGDVATVDTLIYVKGDQSTITFQSGAIISGTHVVLKLADPSGIRDVKVTRNGQELDMKPSDEGELVINSAGVYKVTVTDNLGNVNIFTFTNAEEDISTGTIDGVELIQDKQTYGHESMEVGTLYEGVNTILVQVGEVTETYEFHYESGVLTYGQYYVYSQERIEEEEVIIRRYAEYRQNPNFSLDLNGDLIRLDTWYPVLEKENYGIYVMFDQENHAHYRVSVLKGTIRVEDKFACGSIHLPNCYSAVLSTDLPAVVLRTGGEIVENIESLDTIFVSGDLTIDEVVSPTIAKIEYVYGETQIFDKYTTLYENGQWKMDFIGTEDGFYHILVTNVFNNKTSYLVNKIQAFASVVKVTYADNDVTVTYQEHKQNVYSNKSIELIVMSTEVQFEIDGKVDEKYGIIEGNTKKLLLTSDGTYKVRVIAANGIIEPATGSFVFEIDSGNTLLYQESWITGYNEKAILRDKGYTNTLCSVNPACLEDGVVYVDMVVNDEHPYVLYDALTDDRRTDVEALKNVIGQYGVGKYEVRFRNRYGDLATKTVYYNNVPSIVLTRTIASDPLTYQTYDLALALTKGFYSNNVLSFASSSSAYQFTIDGEEYSLEQPKVLEFTNSSGKGKFKYLITYLDAYGNYVEFEAYLYRDDVAFDASSMRLIGVNNVNYTKDDIYITFEEGLKATLSVNGEEAKDYFSGEVHYADGDYLFTVRDIAGNIATYAVTHKSINHYSLLDSTTGQEIVDGGVVNNGSVIFSANEGSRIKYIVRNGELVADYNSNTFSVTGHYEILIEDAIGNQAYEEFTIINNELAYFDYTAPFEYEVTDVSRINPDGTHEMLTIRGKSIHLDVNGDYVVTVTSTKTTASFNFFVTINNAPPTASLNGATDGGVTARDVTLSGLRSGDVVKIYKDGELLSTTTISISTDSPKITTGGRYRVTVTNLQGVTVEFNFTRKAVSNVAGSIFFIVSSVLVVVGLGIGLVYHTKLKTDD